MEPNSIAVLDLGDLTQAATAYTNLSLASVNDHVVKVSVMTEPYHWHYHPNSDETFIMIEGVLLIDLETGMIELQPGQLVTIPRNRIHRTRPKGERSVNLTVEHSQIETVSVDGAGL